MKRVKNINPEILKKCREQLDIDIETAKKEVSKIEKIENGEDWPTYNQLDILADLYLVPSWVFIREEIPKRFLFSTTPEFRIFPNQKNISYEKAKKVLVQIQKIRELFIEINKDIGTPIPAFKSPEILESPKEMASTVRGWLGCSKDDAYTFEEWRNLLEKKNIFIFITTKYKGWSKLEDPRGLAVYTNVLPLIVINNSDSYNAQSFTLFHELGHILKKSSNFDADEDFFFQKKDEEKWCNDFSADLLMPEASMLDIDLPEKLVPQTFKKIEKYAKKFKVSTLAFSYRMHRLKKMNKFMFNEIKKKLDDEYQERKSKMEKKRGGNRNREEEILKQFGKSYLRTMFHAYNAKEFSLYKLCKFLDLKKPESAIHLMENL